MHGIIKGSTKMYSRWLFSWLFCLKHNVNYRAYCIAIEMKDKSTVDRLKEKFENIAELYVDWGDIRSIKIDANSPSFEAWLDTRKHLFYRSEFVETIDDPFTYVPQPDRLLISIPMHQKKSTTIGLISHHMDSEYRKRARLMKSSAKPALKFFQPMLPPKYKPLGDNNKATSGAVKKALYVGKYQFIKKDGKRLSLADTVIAILLDPKNPFGEKWRMTESDKVAYEKGRLKKSVVYASKMKQIKVYRKEFNALVKNTIHGRFPDFS